MAAVRLTRAERAQIRDNPKMLARIEAADIIAVQYKPNGARAAIWKRRSSETEVQPPQVLAFEVSTATEVSAYRKIVRELKPPSDDLSKIEFPMSPETPATD